MFDPLSSNQNATHTAPAMLLTQQNKRGVGRYKEMLIPLLLLTCIGSAWAATDPTLPNPAWLATQPNAQPSVSPATPEKSGGVSLILTGESRKFAIIDGQVVRLRDVHNGSKVLSIQPGVVVTNDRSKSLKLTPNVTKRVARPTPLKKTSSTQRKSNFLLNSNRGMQ